MRFLAGTILPFLFAMLCSSCSNDVTGGDASRDDFAESLMKDSRLNVVATLSGEDYEQWKGYRIYQCTYRQPLDHNDAGAGDFSQTFMLFLKDAAKPTVLYTNGYAISTDPAAQRFDNLHNVLDANIVYVGYRYFDGSLAEHPDTTEWRYFDSRQASADLHDVSVSLHRLLGGKWVSTGKSKDGMAAYTHRALYPEDVDVTVPFVAPISTEQSDYTLGDYCFLGTESRPDVTQDTDEACRQMHDYLLQVARRYCSGNAADDHYFFNEYLRRRTAHTSYGELSHQELRDMVNDFVVQIGEVYFQLWSYNRYVHGDYFRAFDSTAEWQQWVREEALPIDGLTDAQMVDFLIDGLIPDTSPKSPFKGDLEGLSPKRETSVYPYYVQAARELGTIAYDCRLFADTPLFRDFSPEEIATMGNQVYSFLVRDDWSQAEHYDNSLMRYIKSDFLPHDAQHPIVFVYGQHDPWTGASIHSDDMGPAVRRLIVPSGYHSNDIYSFPAATQQELYQYLKEAGLEVRQSQYQ